MKVEIVIECENIHEFHLHLEKLTEQIKERTVIQKLNPLIHEFKKDDADSLCDSNCYGYHDVEIFPEL